MPASAEVILGALPHIRDFSSFCRYLLVDALGWPLPENINDPDDLTFEWSSADLRVQGLEKYIVGGRVLQLQNLIPQQPWGIFLIEFKDPAVFSTGRGMTGPLRQVLRGLVASARRQANLPWWNREDLLFIATHKWSQYAFVHFNQPKAQDRVARLASFGWTTEAARRTRTIVSHNLPHLAWPDDPVDHSGWRDAWSHAWDKDALTKQFYEVFAGNEKRGQRGVYPLLRDDLLERNKLNTKEASERALLLLNRLLFLYFVQRKGWLAQDSEFLRHRFSAHAKQPCEATYYQQVLIPLFDRLSIEGARDEKPWNEIPFLNGGLFEEDSAVANDQLKIANSTFHTIFDELLDRFNFTVTEDTPLDVEVAIDPEMLGKIFECLTLKQEQGTGILAEAEGLATEKKDQRKLTGSYYTPRAIVHFMCQESLKEHLRSAWEKSGVAFHSDVADATLGRLMSLPLPDPPTEQDRQELRNLLAPGIAEMLREALRTLRVVDPAVGSGAFLVGMLHEVVRLRALLDLHLAGRERIAGANYIHDLKKEVIEHSLFGVDLQEQAVRLCELRLWLSLVVDYQFSEQDKGGFAATIRSIPTLPNLSYRVVRGDSLLERLFGHAVQLDVLARDPRSREIIDELRKEKETFFALRDPAEKRRRELVILEKQVRLAENLIEAKTQFLETKVYEQPDIFGGNKSARDQKMEEEQRALIALWQDLKAKVHRAGEEVRRLLAQPRLPAHGDLQRLRQQYFQTKESPTFFWQVDFAEVFNEKGGFDIVIANPPYIRMELLKAITPDLKRLYRSATGRADAYIYFFEKGVGLLHDGGVLSYISSSTYAKTGSGEALRSILRDETTLRRFVDFGDLQVFEGVTTYPAILLLNNSKPADATEVRGNVVQSLDTESLDRELHAPGVLVRQKELETGGWRFEDKRLTRLRQKIKDAGVPLRDYCGSPLYGIKTGLNEAFVINSATRDALVSQDRRSSEILKPFLEGKDLKPWRTEWRGLWLIYTYHGIDMKPYPVVLEYLRSFKKRLEARATAHTHQWYEVQQPQFEYSKSMAKPKIIYPHFSRFPKFSFEPDGYFSNDKTYLIPSEDWYLLALLNSLVLWYFITLICPAMRGGLWRYELRVMYMETLPIAKPSASDRKKLSDLAETLSAEQCSNRLALEAELNDRVAQLYGLTPEEKKIVEGILPTAAIESEEEYE